MAELTRQKDDAEIQIPTLKVREGRCIVGKGVGGERREVCSPACAPSVSAARFSSTSISSRICGSHRNLRSCCVFMLGLQEIVAHKTNTSCDEKVKQWTEGRGIDFDSSREQQRVVN